MINVTTVKELMKRQRKVRERNTCFVQCVGGKFMKLSKEQFRQKVLLQQKEKKHEVFAYIRTRNTKYYTKGYARYYR